jgi:hypothetical protein
MRLVLVVRGRSTRSATGGGRRLPFFVGGTRDPAPSSVVVRRRLIKGALARGVVVRGCSALPGTAPRDCPISVLFWRSEPDPLAQLSNE